MVELLQALALDGKGPRRFALMGHVIADEPSPEAVRSMISTMVSQGARVIEIQIPFSEPVADGPIFLAANHRALRNGVDYHQSLALVSDMTRKFAQCHFLVMTYLNIPYRRGYQNFAKDLRSAGAKGVIVPDLPLEYAEDFERCLTHEGLFNMRLIAPNASDARIAMLTTNARGIIYAVARRGVTGSATSFGLDLQNIKDFVGRIRRHSSLPIALGFGIKSAEDVRLLREFVDLAVIGTASLEAWIHGQQPLFDRLWNELGVAAR